ncbi:MAG TPA: hypothetical protein VHX39_00030 [Acetobacteraceae bacterium]|jgi:hypothetical protein|nr:hypothetical protein [Acetobacteraceae bacterium]
MVNLVVADTGIWLVAEAFGLLCVNVSDIFRCAQLGSNEFAELIGALLVLFRMSVIPETRP